METATATATTSSTGSTTGTATRTMRVPPASSTTTTMIRRLASTWMHSSRRITTEGGPVDSSQEPASSSSSRTPHALPAHTCHCTTLLCQRPAASALQVFHSVVARPPGHSHERSLQGVAAGIPMSERKMIQRCTSTLQTSGGLACTVNRSWRSCIMVALTRPSTSQDSTLRAIGIA